MIVQILVLKLTEQDFLAPTSNLDLDSEFVICQQRGERWSVRRSEVRHFKSQQQLDGKNPVYFCRKIQSLCGTKTAENGP